MMGMPRQCFEVVSRLRLVAMGPVRLRSAPPGGPGRAMALALRNPGSLSQDVAATLQ